MRWLVVLLGLLGGVAAGHLGLRWLAEAARHEAALGPGFVTGHQAVQLSLAAHALLGAGLAGVVGAVLASQHRGLTAGTLLLTAGLVPGILDLRAFVVTCVLIMAGLLGFGLGGTRRAVSDRTSPSQS